MQKAVRCLAVTCLIASLAVLSVLAESSQTIWVWPPDDAKATGSLIVDLKPIAARRDGARWRVDRGAWQKSGVIISGLSVGQHTVTFKTISGWDTPKKKNPSITVDQTTAITGNYILSVGPVAAFSATPTSGLAPLGVQFNDESVPGASPITSWAWDFNNDGVVDSVEQNQSHTYRSAGDYDVTLTVSSASGTDSVTYYALINADTEIMLPGNVPLEMVWIPAGSFKMGRYTNEPDSLPYESPRHKVSFANGFWIGKYEVTQAQWMAVMGSNPSYFSSRNLKRPVESVSWNTVQTFITSVNALGQATFHLPTEAQWEYACRAGTTTRFYWGDDPFYGQIDTYAWNSENSGLATHPVGQKLPNAWGLYDMSGNVEEWCEDWFHSDYTGAPTDGSAWVSPGWDQRIIRGGSWLDRPSCRSANRYHYHYPPGGSNTLGFRLATVAAPTPAFSATPTSGGAPLEVQFSDESIPGTSPITSWEWDFENDGIVDSTEQNPQPTFQDEGLYDVKLSVGSASGSNSLTKNDYINVTTYISQIIMLTGDVPLEMVWIPAGSFKMGRYPHEPDSFSDEGPQHPVTFANGFWIGKYEVTQAQWLAVMGNNPSNFTGDLNRPVERVSWDDAQTFISAMNALAQGTFHLPSEAQWEYAYRAGTTTRFYWGDDLSTLLAGNYAWLNGNSSSTTHPVGQKLPNAWGLYDMSGNVWEWCEDWYHSGYTGAPTNGSAWVSPTGLSRVSRGGAWNNDPNYIRAAIRNSSYSPSSTDVTLGFRLSGNFLSEVVGPTAAFSATPTSGVPPLDVQFTDESTPGSSPITSWAWDFNSDGVVDSTEQNPQPTFLDAGPYNVTLTVGSVSGSDSLTKNDYISVNQIIMLPGDVPLEMHWIPAGSFMMGRYTNEQESSPTEDPQHQVTFADGFWMGKYEVTQAQWLAVMGSNPSYFTGDLSRPVETVSWDTIQTFIGVVNALGQGTVHLPTEAQWEYACRAETTTRFYWGDDLSYNQIGAYAWYTGNSGSTTHPVGQKTPNAWGLYDISGNVWEWCEDWYHPNYTGAPTDGSAWVSPMGSKRVARGGNGYDAGKRCRSANRSSGTPSDTTRYHGFRLAGYFPSVAGPTAAFSATPTSGVPPLDVQFTDESTPGGSPITSWAWDFNNDGTVDSTEQNPAHTYSSAGVYDVALTVSCLSGSDMLTQQALINVLSVVGPTAEFSASPTSGPPPLLVQFTDESTPGSTPITSWAWDFNNDGVVDSTEQNPQPTYQDEGTYDVKLSIGSASGPDSLTKNDYINTTSSIMLPGDVPLELVWIPAGSFTMGRNADEQDSLEIEDPQHQVTFTNGFWIGKYEVTLAQWLAVMGQNPNYFTGDLNRPVERVSWETIQTFIGAVNALGQGTVHLPSEAQWEYACRAGTTTRLFWGDDLSFTQIGTYAWYTGNSASTTHPVGQKSPNAWGLFDMAGNVWEWCEDWYHSDYTGAPTDGSAWVSPTGSNRVIRGGSWDSTGVNCRSAFRSYSTPSSAYNDIGFRLAK